MISTRSHAKITMTLICQSETARFISALLFPPHLDPPTANARRFAVCSERQIVLYIGYYNPILQQFSDTAISSKKGLHLT